MKTILATDREPELNAQMINWAGNMIWGKSEDFGPCMTLGVVDGGRLIAVVVYHNYHPENGVIELSAGSTSKRWLTRAVLREMFATAFTAMDCQLVVLRIDSGDAPLKRMLQAYGFECYLIPRLRGRGKDEFVCTLTDDAWRTNKFNMRSHSGQVLPETNSA